MEGVVTTSENAFSKQSGVCKETKMRDPKDLKVSIIGGGLVGSLCACILGKRGVQVKLYEFRDDIRQMEVVQGRSINLALSVRGRSALKLAGLEEEVIERHGIPMKGRMVHSLTGQRNPVPYDPEGRCIYSVGRRFLNETLLTAAEKNPNVEIFFKKKFLDCNFKEGSYKVLGPDGGVREDKTDLLIGCDGAYSSVRRQMLKMPRFNYSQHYIEHGYLELCIPATESGEFAMEKNYLHIWPRHTFMMIALPNQDKTYTVTLFMPFEIFESIKTPDNLIQFFKTNFSDAIPLIGREKLIEDFFKTPPSALVSIKCNPYHVEDRALILGDAAHAMVPFYGQGMNAGFEDCEILAELLEAYSYEPKNVLPLFSERRHQDAESICDLAMYNYVEMRHLVTSKKFLLRKKLDNALNKLFPKSWIPLYTMVTFSKLRYSHCIYRKHMQDKILATFLWATGILLFSILIGMFTRITL
ncbi:kynurenine 3-monooxygenase [Parasteatoda tepidariorum]|uniref:kynurenine 3-monooxygenase n=1 Tax=Parasteatoda tepidariorum TaxID=114398 RepID=UPI001C72493A|nr:kynurenine 3-monooxygenase-like [Parasteatoda tepidariorum]